MSFPIPMSVVATLASLALLDAAPASVSPTPREEGQQPVVVKDRAARIAELRKEIAERKKELDQLLAEERAEGQASAAAAPRAGRNPFELAKPWIEGALQIQDPARRQAAIEEIRAALAGGDAALAHAALKALAQIREVEYEKKPFRELVLPLTTAADPQVRQSAFYALANTHREPADLERVLAAAEAPGAEQMESLTHLLFMFSDGDLTGRAGAVVLRRIEDADSRGFRQVVSGLWGARVSAELEAKLLELARGADYEARHDAIYFGLSTLRDKSEVVIDELVKTLADPDFNNSGRALWGLGQGVPPALQPKVADALLALAESRSDASTVERSYRIVGDYGDASHAAKLDAVAANASAGESRRSKAKEAAERIRSRSR